MVYSESELKKVESINKENICWEKLVVSPQRIINKLEPGMNIFIGTGVAEPRTLVKRLMSSNAGNLEDLVLIQIFGFGDVISSKKLFVYKYRLKTFFSGWMAADAISSGQIDFIPSRFVKIPLLIESEQIPVDVAFVQVTPPDQNGYCNLGVALDASQQAIDKATLVVGEINKHIPHTYGDTLVPVSKFDFFVYSDEKPFYFNNLPLEDVFDKIALNIASIIEDGSCLAYALGPVFDALGKHLVNKKDLGIHSPFFTDSLMNLVKSGAVTNRLKHTWRGKSVASFILGSKELFQWIDNNPLVELQGIDKICDPNLIRKNRKVVSVIPARKVDLSGGIALQSGKANIISSTGEVIDFFLGAEMSFGGITIIALPSRNREQKSNILISVNQYDNQLSLKESISNVITEYGIAHLNGRTIRERAQALIDIAHPDDRKTLLMQAKSEKILYEDQLFIKETAYLYPSEISFRHKFADGVDIRFRAVKPSDEEEMRQLFYRFSDEAVYYRYFVPIKSMPHSKMQEYVNVDYSRAMSIVGLIGQPGRGHIITEARYIKGNNDSTAEIAFIVDEKYHGIGIATFLYKLLVRLAKERGIKGFTASVLASNRKMIRVFEKGEYPVNSHLKSGVYEIEIPFTEK